MANLLAPPKLLICELDNGMLADVEAQNRLLESWMTWTDANRPLLLFHGRMSLAELERVLLATTLPPADFLVGAGVSMLARLGRWHDLGSAEHLRDGPWARRGPQQLIESMLAQARLEMSCTNGSHAAFPRVQSAALTASGLIVTFSTFAKPRRQNPNAVLSWILKQLQFDTCEVHRFAASHALRLAGPA